MNPELLPIDLFTIVTRNSLPVPQKKLMRLGLPRVVMDENNQFSFTVSAKEWNVIHPSANPWLDLQKNIHELLIHCIYLRGNGRKLQITMGDCFTVNRQDETIHFQFGWSVSAYFYEMMPTPCEGAIPLLSLCMDEEEKPSCI